MLKIVTKDSTLLKVPAERQVNLALDKTHSEMCKFAEVNGKDYKVVWKMIKKFVGEALQSAKEGELRERLAALEPPQILFQDDQGEPLV